MNERRLVLGIAAAAVLAMAIVAWLLLSPGWAVRALDQMAEAQLGRHFTAKGGAHLDFSPLAIRFEEAALAGTTETGERLVTAKSLVIPVSFGELVSRRPQVSALALREAEFALLIDERGQASWDFPAAALTGGALRLTLEQASFRYFDARNGQALRLANVDGVLGIAADGSVAFNGSAVINSHVAQIDFGLKSLPRVNADGSPLELAIETDAASLSFSGRLSTAKVMNLAGPLSITAPKPAEAARWAGLALPDDVTLPGPLNLTGALDSAGRAYALRNAALSIGQLQAAGDVVADLRGERPRLQANLNSGPLWLDALLPASGAEAGNWGRKPLPTTLLRSFDAEVNVLAEAVSMGPFTAGPSRLAATLKEGKLNASGGLRLATGGTASFSTAVDAVVLPPAGTLTLKVEKAEIGPLLSALTGIGALSGAGDLSAELSAQGRTQEELAGTLKGSASLSLAQAKLTGIDAGSLVSALNTRILDGWAAAPGETPLSSVTANLNIADGVAKITSASAIAGAMTLNISGTVDLLRRALDIRAMPGPPETAPLPVAVAVTGNWAAPRIYPDIPDILNNPEGGFARLRTPPAPQPSSQPSTVPGN